MPMLDDAALHIDMHAVPCSICKLKAEYLDTLKDITDDDMKVAETSPMRGALVNAQIRCHGFADWQ